MASRHSIREDTLSVACGADDGSAPKMNPLSDQVTYVGQDLNFEIAATDSDTETLEFGFVACHVNDEGCKKEGITNRADLRQAGNLAIFRWTPIMSDVGMHSFHFTASDGKNTAKQSIAIEVKVDQGASGVPVFRKPMGAGTSLDLSVKPCVDIPVLVEDADSLGVSIIQDAPLIEGAQLRQVDPFSATWRWCPTAAQIRTTKTSTLRLRRTTVRARWYRRASSSSCSRRRVRVVLVIPLSSIPAPPLK